MATSGSGAHGPLESEAHGEYEHAGPGVVNPFLTEADMIRVVLRMVLIGAATWASVPSGAWADPAPATDKKQVAKQYVDAGKAAQDAGDYDTAIALYEKAYQLVPHPKLLYDIAIAQRLAGRLDEALRQYKQYVAVEPSGQEAQIARDVIAEIEAKLASSAQPARDAPGGNSQRTDGSIPIADRRGSAMTNATGSMQGAGESSGMVTSASTGEHPRGDALASHAGADASEGSRNASDEGTGEASPGRTVRIIGLASGATGFATLAVGIGFGLHARALSDEVSMRFDQSKYDAGVQANEIAIAGVVSGGVLIATGAVLYWWGHTQDRVSEKAVVMPVISDRSVGLTLIGCWP